MKKYDLMVMGMGPAGMAVSAMGSAMGLSVVAFEKHKVGGECLNCGCIPSKALLKAGEALHSSRDLAKYGVDAELSVKHLDPMAIVRSKIGGINNKKMMSVFEKVDLVKEPAEFVDERTVQAGVENYTSKKIFIATGTEPMIPPIPGLKDIPDVLTNVNMFELKEIPKSLTIIGGGAIGSEMAQAFSRLGAKVSIIHMDSHLAPLGDEEAGTVLEEAFKNEGISVYDSAAIESVSMQEGQVVVTSDKVTLRSEKLLVAAGRKPVLEPLKLDNAGVAYTKRGITVDSHMRTSRRHIYAVGDCNGQSLFSHAAMHQGMLALMHAMSPFSLPFLKRERYAVPWSIFTEPEIAQVGLTRKQALEKGITIEVHKKDFRTYGRTVADGHPDGFIKVVTDSKGRIHGVTIVGENASELIHEWTMAIQYKKKMHHIMMMQHSFPSVSMINKMVAEEWMMKKMKTPWIQRIARKLI
ncbi:MAG: NAD(P)/FAD-dependent oxidoreductase [Synergistota bacterium]|nr:NAD(P)/FAD-dependent oxidoreductase [Synergistota bacterium]